MREKEDEYKNDTINRLHTEDGARCVTGDFNS